jgi:hypothetical protein
LGSGRGCSRRGPRAFCRLYIFDFLIKTDEKVLLPGHCARLRGSEHFFYQQIIFFLPPKPIRPPIFKFANPKSNNFLTRKFNKNFQPKKTPLLFQLAKPTINRWAIQILEERTRLNFCQITRPCARSATCVSEKPPFFGTTTTMKNLFSSKKNG